MDAISELSNKYENASFPISHASAKYFARFLKQTREKFACEHGPSTVHDHSHAKGGGGSCCILECKLINVDKIITVFPDEDIFIQFLNFFRLFLDGFDTFFLKSTVAALVIVWKY